MRSHHVVAATWLALAGAMVPGYAENPAAPAPLTTAQERGLKAKDTFRECADCPEMVVVPAGSFTMGAPAEEDTDYDAGPQHPVTIRQPFAVGKWHVTVDQFGAFVRETGYESSKTCQMLSGTDGSWRNPGFAQEGSHPVICVTWNDAKAYVDWLAKKTGKPYRLLSEAEWEYAARGRTRRGVYPRFWFGNDEKRLCRNGNGADQKLRDTVDLGAPPWIHAPIAPCNDGYAYTSPAGHYPANAFGLYDMAGNASQWTEDCDHPAGYDGAPDDGSAWTAGGCLQGGSDYHIIRGGDWSSSPQQLRAAARVGWKAGQAGSITGFRLARTLTP